MVQKLLPQKAQPLSCSHSGRLGNTAGEKVRQKSTQGKPSADRCIPEHFSEVDCRVMGRKSPCCYFALFYLFYFQSGFNDNTTKLSFFRNENTCLVGIEKSNNGPDGCWGQCESLWAGTMGSRLTASQDNTSPEQPRAKEILES